MEEKTEAPPASKPPVSSKGEPAKAPAKAKMSVDELVRKHLAECSKAEKLPDDHLLVYEHAAGLEPWQRRALLARFYAHGLTSTSRIHPEVFQAALDEVLKGRI